MGTHKTSLELKLVERIGREGPMPFRDFMQAALYDPEFGYYNTERPKIGPRGDYYTSSNVHSAFGAALSRVFVQLWESLGSNRSNQLTIVEIGAGTGQLAFDVLTALRDTFPDEYEKTEYLLIEYSPSMRKLQSEKLRRFTGRARQVQLQELTRKPGTVLAFSNELVDAMPVHRVRRNGDRTEEQYVIAEGDRLDFSWGKPSSNWFERYFERVGAELADGQVVEINLDAVRWLREIASAIEHGFLVTIDYGDETSLLYGADRQRGTLRSFYNHRLVEWPLDRAGGQDLTASVNFTALMEYGRDFGLETISYERQAAFLIRAGLGEIVGKQQVTKTTPEALKNRLLLKTLIVPGGVSDNFRVLIQRKV